MADFQTARTTVAAALEAGYTFFDHADIYCDGRAEEVFGRVLREMPGMREKMVIASKCGIRFAGDPLPHAPYRYDFSQEYIVRRCETSLRRLGIEQIDLYQLHRPDWLMHAAEVAEAFSKLQQQGKVRAFGVSNFSPTQLNLLQSAFPRPLLVNQVEISLCQLAAFSDGVLDQCQQQSITPLAWSPLGGGLLGDGPVDILRHQEKYEAASLLKVVDAIAKERQVSREVIALAWLLKHPAGIVPIVGSAKPDRIKAATAACAVELTREEWYQLLIAARSEPLL